VILRLAVLIIIIIIIIIKQHEQIYKKLSRSATAIEEHDWQM